MSSFFQILIFILLNQPQMYCHNDGCDVMSTISSNDDADSTTSGSSLKVRIMFPALSMMDLSDNRILEVPHNIHELVRSSNLVG